MDVDQRPSTELHLAKLSQLSKALTSAASSISASIELREDLIQQLRSFEHVQVAALEDDREALAQVSQKQTTVESATHEAQDLALHHFRSTTPEMEPPAVEALVDFISTLQQNASDIE